MTGRGSLFSVIFTVMALKRLLRSFIEFLRLIPIGASFKIMNFFYRVNLLKYIAIILDFTENLFSESLD
jgi:hypothetical protein